MALLKDVGRVLHGLYLVAEETVARKSQGGELRSLLNKTILSATDLTGLTKGKLRQLPSSSPIRRDSNYDTSVTTLRESKSVSEPAALSPQPISDLVPSVIAGPSSGGGANFKGIASGLTTEEAARTPPPLNSGDANHSETAAASETVKKLRKPRERRVPSTPFSRALGLVWFSSPVISERRFSCYDSY